MHKQSYTYNFAEASGILLHFSIFEAEVIDVKGEHNEVVNVLSQICRHK